MKGIHQDGRVPPRLHWNDAAQAARWLKGRQSDLRTLGYVAQLPFIHELVIEELVGLSGGASIYRSLARLREAGLLATIRPPLYAGLSQELYCLADLGLATLALSHDIEVGDLVRQLRLAGRQLLALLPELEHLVATYDLLGALAASWPGRPVFLAWERPFRRRFYRPFSTHPSAVTIPAYTALSWDGEPGAFFLVPDRGTIPLGLYRPRLSQLFAFRRVYDHDYRTFPLLVVATWDAERTAAWQAMLDELRQTHGDIELLTRFTQWGELRRGLTGIERVGKIQQLPAAQHLQRVSWHRLVPRRPNSPLPRPVGDALHVPETPTVADGIERIALRLSPADYALLDLVAEHPYLTPDQMAAVLGSATPLVRRRRTRLLTMGVLRLVGAEEIGEVAREQLPELTVAGLELVAAHRGLSLPIALRALGLIGGGPDEWYGPRRSLLLHLTHTRGVDDLFVRLYRTAARRRAESHDDEVILWHNGTACSRHHLRPDGYGLYRHETSYDGFFLEFDRGTMRRHGYRDKFDEYYAYATSRRYARDYTDYPTILFVTVNNRTEEKIAEMAQLGARHYGFALPLLLTCLWRIDDPANPDGLLGRIWREPKADFDERRYWLKPSSDLQRRRVAAYIPAR